jgi:hypothetical protein
MPERQKGQKLSDYVSLCIATRRKEHPEEDQKQSMAICYSMGREHWTKKSSKKN